MHNNHLVFNPKDPNTHEASAALTYRQQQSENTSGRGSGSATLLEESSDTALSAKMLSAQFVRALEETDLLSPQERGELLTVEVLGQLQQNPQTFAVQLVQQQRFTRWQVEQLFSGRIQFRLGGYLLLKLLGAGAMGSVYLAQHRSMNRLVAIKVMSVETLADSQLRKRFRSEIQVTARLQHPHLVQAFDADLDGSQPYLVMEYLEGRDLDYWIRGNRSIDFRSACECIRQACLGMQYAHEQNLIHRDLKPSNLMVTRPSPQGPIQVKVLDLGLARLRGHAGETPTVTQAGDIVGTPEFIAPEQARDAKSADIRSDIFSLGCSLFRLLTGKSAFPSESLLGTLMARTLQDAPALRTVNPNLPEGLERIVARMLARNPSDRFQTPAEVAASLAGFSNPRASDLTWEPAESLYASVQFPQLNASAAVQRLDHNETLAQRSENQETPRRPQGTLRQSLKKLQDLQQTHVQDDSSILFSNQSPKRSQYSRDWISADTAQSRKSDTSFDGLSEYRNADRVLNRPTLIIGLGEHGARLVERLRLRQQHLDKVVQPFFRTLTIDCDPHLPNRLRKETTLLPLFEEQFLPTPLRRSGGELQHLQDWITPDILQLVNARSPEEMRVLGRLALIEHHERLFLRLCEELEHLCSPEVNKVLSQLGLLELQPRVYLAAHMGSGIGSGMFLDLAYMVRRILLEAGQTKPDIRGLLFAGLPPHERRSELPRLCHWMFAQDLQRFLQPQSEFHVRYDSKGMADRQQGSPLRGLVCFDTTAAHLPEPRESAALDVAAEFVYRSTVGLFGRTLAAAEQAGHWDPFQSVGLFSLITPKSTLFRQASRRLIHEVLTHWLTPLTLENVRQLRQEATQWLKQRPWEPPELLGRLHELSNQELGEPVETVLGQFIMDLEFAYVQSELDPLDSPYRETHQQMQAVLGSDKQENLSSSQSNELVHEPLLIRVVRQASQKLVQEIHQMMMKYLAERVEAPGSKIDPAQVLRDVFMADLTQRIELHQEELKKRRPRLAELQHLLAQKLDAWEQSSFPKREHQHPELTKILHHYAREKSRQLFREKLIFALLALRGQLSEMSDVFYRARTYLERMAEHCQTHGTDQSGEPVTDQQMATILYPDGAANFKEATEQVWQQARESFAGLETVVQEGVFAANGGMWQSLSKENPPAVETQVDLLEECIFAWLRANTEQVDVARCFFDRHRRFKRAGEEVLSFFHFAQPTLPTTLGVSPNISALPKLPTEYTSPIRESFFLIAPPTPSGLKLVQQVQESIPEQPVQSLWGSADCIFCRIRMHPTLARMLPSWIFDTAANLDINNPRLQAARIFPEADTLDSRPETPTT